MRRAAPVFSRGPAPKHIPRKQTPPSSLKKTIYKRIPIPGSVGKYVTIRSRDLTRSVDIFYDHKHATLQTSVLLKIRSARTYPDIIRVLNKANRE